MLVIEMVVHDSRAAVCKGTLFARESLITDTIRALRSMQEQRELIRARQRFVVYFGRLSLYRQAGFGALSGMGAPDRLSFAAESHHEIDGLDPSLRDLVFG
jgi:hypothetical protein